MCHSVSSQHEQGSGSGVHPSHHAPKDFFRQPIDTRCRSAQAPGMTTTPTTTDPTDPRIVRGVVTYQHDGPFDRFADRYQPVSHDDIMDVATFSGIGVTYDVVLIGSAYPMHAFDVVATGGPWPGRFLVRTVRFDSSTSYADAYATVCADVLAMVANQLRQEIG